MITTAFVTSTGVSALAAAAIYAARDPLANWLFEGQPDPSLVALAALTLPLLAVANMTREVMRLTLQPWRYVASSLIATIGGAGISVYAVTSLDAGVKGILTATLIGTAAAAVYGVGVARTYLHGHYDWGKLRTMLRYGLPLIPGLVALWATAYADRAPAGEPREPRGRRPVRHRLALRGAHRAAADRLRDCLPAVPAGPARRRSGTGERAARQDRYR